MYGHTLSLHDARPICLSLGSNMEPEAHLRSAIAALRARFGQGRVSTVYRTRAVGFDGGDFLNAAAVVETDLEPEALDVWLHALEDAHGRHPSGPRFRDSTLPIPLALYPELLLDSPAPLTAPRGEPPHALVLQPHAELVPPLL